MRAARALRVALLATAVLAGLALARPQPVVSPDQEQPRLNQAAPIPREGAPVGQTFEAGHDGLSAVEVLAVVYDDAAAGGSPALLLRLLDAQGRQVAASRFDGFAHNAPLRLEFPPEPASSLQRYTLSVEAVGDQGGATVWAYSLDGYARGSLLVGGSPSPGDLRFTTSYTLLWPGIARTLAAEFLQLARWAAPLWAILFAPGLLALRFLPGWGRASSGWTRLGLALGLSLALLPLLWLWVTVAGLRLSGLALSIFYGAIGLAWLGLAAWKVLTRRAALPRLTAHHVGMGLVLLAALAARLLAARDLAFPPWVDSPHHYVITRLLAETGRVPQDYSPVLPVDRFTYHFGFHALAVTLHWLTGTPLFEVFLPLGQILNALTPLAAYALAASLTGRPRAGLAAAFFVGCVSFFPGYYLAWGRYTQLTGILIFAPALAAVWRALFPQAGPELEAGLTFPSSPGARSNQPDVILRAGGPKNLAFTPETRDSSLAAPAQSDSIVKWSGAHRRGEGLGVRGCLRPAQRGEALALLSAGLFLTHYRLFVFLATFVIAALVVRGRDARGWKAIGTAAGLGAALALPWMLQLGAQVVPRLAASPGRLAAGEGYNAFPFEYFASGLERGWLVLAVAAVAWGVARRDRALIALAAWVALTFALLNLGPGTWLVNNNSWAITLFVPGVAALGWGADRLLGLGIWGLGFVPCVLRLGSCVLIAFAGARGLRAQAEIVRPATVLAAAEDAAALQWVQQNTPPDSVFLVNGWLWLQRIWASPDGGAWLWPLAGRQSTLPPLDYAYQAEWLAEVNEFNETAVSVFAERADTPEALALLRRAGVTHVFIGAKGGTLKPEAFAASPRYRLLYSNGGAWVFEVEP